MTIAVEAFAPILLFVFVATITPGPNNLMLANSGLHFGLRATLPHIVGIHLGLYTLIMFAAFGLGSFVLGAPAAILALKLCASIYLLYLAYKFLAAQTISGGQAMLKPLTSLQACMFQFVNPKAWVMSGSAVALTLPLMGKPLSTALMLCFSWASLGIACNICWVLAGSSLKRVFDKPRARFAVNGVLALLLGFTVALFWLDWTV